MKLTLATLMLALAGNAFGSLVLAQPDPLDLQGTGLGTVSTLLTITSPGSTTVATGCVSPGTPKPSTSGCGFADANVQNGMSQTGTPTLEGLGITDLNTLAIVFNAAQPGSSNSVTLTDLVLTLYGTSTGEGGAPATFSLDQTYTLDRTRLGTGQSGFVFQLDAEQAEIANNAVAGNFGSVQVGLGARVQDSTGGLETFFATSIEGDPNTPPAGEIPEPSTMALMVTGLGLAGLARLLRRNA